MTLQTIDLTPRIGTEIRGDRQTILSGAYSQQIRNLLEERGVLVFRGLKLEESEQLAFSSTLGEIIPLTYFLRVVRGIMLKGAGWAEVGQDVWPLGVFLVLIAVVALKRYRTTLDAA